ncbi:MAG: hypothetical protein AB1861_16190 [Cyanobacteriota bacterium]
MTILSLALILVLEAKKGRQRCKNRAKSRAGSRQQAEIQHEFIAYPEEIFASLAFSSGKGGMRRREGVLTESSGASRRLRHGEFPLQSPVAKVTKTGKFSSNFGEISHQNIQLVFVFTTSRDRPVLA